MICTNVDFVQYGLDVTDDVSVKANTEDHPDDGHYALIISHSSHITIANSCEGLESPVHTGRVFVASGCVHEVKTHYPGIRLEVIQLTKCVPEASDEVDNEED